MPQRARVRYLFDDALRGSHLSHETRPHGEGKPHQVAQIRSNPRIDVDEKDSVWSQESRPDGETAVHHLFNKSEFLPGLGCVVPGHSDLAIDERRSEKPEVDGSTPSLTTTLPPGAISTWEFAETPSRTASPTLLFYSRSAGIMVFHAVNFVWGRIPNVFSRSSPRPLLEEPERCGYQQPGEENR